MDSCIRVVDLTKNFQRVEVVKSISFEVLKGKVCAFLGPNGAGKSTTLNMLTTLLKKSRGKIYIEGMDIDFLNEEIRKTLGVVFQEDVLDGELTVRENLYFRAGLYPMSKEQIIKRLDEVVDLLSIKPLLYKRYKILSGGQKRLVQIGRSLMAHPKLLILDEPTIGLDPLVRSQLWEVLLKINREDQITIFFSTHYIEETEYADHVCIINSGNILLCNSIENLLAGGNKKRQGDRIKDIYIDLLRRE